MPIRGQSRLLLVCVGLLQERVGDPGLVALRAEGLVGNDQARGACLLRDLHDRIRLVLAAGAVTVLAVERRLARRVRVLGPGLVLHVVALAAGLGANALEPGLGRGHGDGTTGVDH